MRTKLLLLFFALGEITASAQTDSLPNITKTSNGKLIDPIQIHEVVVTGTRNETDIRHLPMTISVIDRKQIEQSMQPVSYTHLRAHETGRNLVCRLLLEKKKQKNTQIRHTNRG